MNKIAKLIISYNNVFKHPFNNQKYISTLLRVIFWKINQFSFKFPFIYQLTSKHKCICYPKSAHGTAIIHTHWPEYWEMNFINTKLKASSNFIDVGAGFGDYSLIAADKISKGTILAFEPSKEPFQQLLENIRLNNIANIIPYKMILGDQIGHEYFNEEATTELSHISTKKTGTKIKCSTIDAMIKMYKLNKVDFLKIDVEGAEMLVLKGAINSLKQGIIKCMIIELNSNSTNFNSSHSQAINFLERNSYKLFMFSSKGRLTEVIDLPQKLTQNIIAVLNR